MELAFKKATAPRFEINLVTRNASDEPTGTKNYVTDDAYKLSQFFLRHKGKPKRKNKEIGVKDNIKVVKDEKTTQVYVDKTERKIDGEL